MDIRELLKDFNRDGIIELINAYDRYVIEVVDREDGSVPVCFAEWLDADLTA